MKITLRSAITAILVLFTLGAGLLPEPVLAAPSIIVSPASGAPGTRVTVAGMNFVSYAGEYLKIFLGDKEASISSILVPPTGLFQSVFEIPAYSSPGTTVISVRGQTGTSIAQGSFVIPAPDIRLDTWGGPAGTSVTASCKGFFAGKTVNFSYLYDDTAEMIGTQTAGETGDCTLKFDIPASPPGKHLITASNAEGHFASAGFEIIPSVSIEPRNAAVGDKVVITGTGFTANEEVDVHLHDMTVAYATVQERGTFFAVFLVPVLKAGVYPVGIEERARGTKWLSLNIVSRLTISKMAGDVGTKLTINGTGFEVDGIVHIKYDSQEINTVLADDVGAFAYTFSIPVSTAGAHFITATDGINTQQVVFTVESEPPSPPEPISPKSRAGVSPPLTLDWEGVYDPSPPTVYTLQIARTDDFFRPVLEKSGLTVSQYTLSGTETLWPNRRWDYYYWRVRATDGAGNVGEWSDPVAFHVRPTDFLPAWSKYVLIVVQVLITALFAIQLSMALSNRRKKE